MKSVPIYRVNAVLLLFVLTTVILYYGRFFLIPLTFSILLSMLLLPVSRKLEGWGMSPIWATLACMLIFLLFVFGLIAILAAEADAFSEDFPQFKSEAQKLIESGQQWVQKKFGVPPQSQMDYVKKGASTLSQSGGSSVTAFFSGLLGALSGFVLVLLFFFFLMWKREKYEEFLLRLVSAENRPEVKKEAENINKVAFQYLIGRLISILFLATVYTLGFTLIGLKNGALVGLVAVIPTIIPYVGAFIGGIFPLVMALVSGSPDLVLPVIAILVVAQIIDNNIIEPLAEGESLHISPIFTIVAIVLGELTWGIAGMILFIPMIAILKIVCDHIPALHPYGFLMANDVDTPEWVEKIKKWFKKK